MLPWLVTFHLTRLGFEAQNAAAFRFLRLVRNASAKTASLNDQGLQKISARKQAQKPL